MAQPTLPVDPVRHGGAGFRAFLNIAELWCLSDEEQMQILGVHDLAIYEELKVGVRAHEAVPIPMDMIVRIGCVLSIYASLATLLSHERSADWIHAPNKGSIFGGNSALAVMTSGALEDLNRVAQYLLGQVHG
jgi:hypothetical protein